MRWGWEGRYEVGVPEVNIVTMSEKYAGFYFDNHLPIRYMIVRVRHENISPSTSSHLRAKLSNVESSQYLDGWR